MKELLSTDCKSGCLNTKIDDFPCSVYTSVVEAMSQPHPRGVSSFVILRGVKKENNKCRSPLLD